MTKIDIISGFLGAGKTTFIKKLLKEAIKGEQVVLIENEFGEIGIDGGFLKDSGIEIREMNSGCICCSLVGDFGKSLAEVLTKYAPDRIMIEPSGVGKLSDVMKAVVDVSADMDVELNSAVTIVDAAKCKMYMKNFGEFFNNQVEHAGTIVLSRTQSMTEEKLQETAALLREHNAKATMITTPWDELNGKQILDAMHHAELDMSSFHQDEEEGHSHEHGHEGECGCGHDHEDHDHHHHHDHEDHDHHHGHEDHDHEHDHGEGCTCGCHEHEGHHHHHDHEGHHHADEVFTSWGVETPRRYGAEELQQMLEKLEGSSEYGIILRAKGILQNTDGSWMQFDLVPEEYEVRGGSPEYTGRLCVIGSKLNEDALKELFQV